MSLSGQLLRGLNWHNFRNLDGEYHKDITNDPHKMEEVKIYLDFIKDKDTDKVHKILERVRLLDLENKDSASVNEAKKLLSNDLLLKVKKEVKE